MKKIMLTLTIAAAIFAGNLQAQTATTGGTPSKEQKKEKLQTMSPDQRRAVVMQHTGTKAVAGKNIKADNSKKAKIRAHKAQLIEKYGSKEAAKAAIQDHHQNAKDNSHKDQVMQHKDQIKEHADSKEEAKAKLQRKHDQNK